MRAAEGSWPAADGAVEVVASPGGPADAVVAFTAHSIVAADLSPDWVRRQLSLEDDLTGPMRPDFLARLGQRLGSRPGSLDVVLSAPPLAGAVIDEPVALGADEADHPRIARARRYRDEVEAYEVPGFGLIVLGRGLAGRWEVAVEVADPSGHSAGGGRALFRSARSLVSRNEQLFAAIAPGNARALRAALAAGFRPLGSEVLFLRPALAAGPSISPRASSPALSPGSRGGG